MKSPADYFKPPIQSQKGLQIFIFERQFPSLFVKFDGVSQSLFCLLHAGGDASIASKVKSDHCDFGMYFLLPEQNGFCLLNAFGASERIGEADSPACGSGINRARQASIWFRPSCHFRILRNSPTGNERRSGGGRRAICLLHTCHRDDRFSNTNHLKRHGVSDWLVISGYRAV